MKKQFIALAAVLMSLNYAYCQTAPIEKETWAEKPAVSSPDSKYGKESAVVMSDIRRIEYVDQPKDEIDEYYTLHKIIHINDDRGIEGFNKIYLGLNDNTDVVDVRARTILPSGKTIELDKSNIKDIQDKDGNTYKIFAMDGLEKGCDVEYFYTFKKPTTFFGREVTQESVPVLKTSFRVIGPERLKFEIKPYNFNVTPTDTVIDKRRIEACDFTNTPGAEEEKYAYYDADLDRLEFKLCYNYSTDKDHRLFTWNDLAKRVYGMYTDYTDKEYKEAAQIVSNNGWDKLSDEPAKIIAVEDYIKKKYSYDEQLRSDDGNTLAKVMETKVAGTEGLMRLYDAIFKTLGVNYQFVLSGDREKFYIDRGFENWNNCDYPMLYFPAENKFMAPTRPDYRYPWILPLWGNTNGLFCKHTTLGNISTALGEVKNVPMEDYDKSYQNVEAKLELNPGLDSMSIDEKQIFGGYASVGYRDAFNFANKEQQDQMVKEMTKAFANSENILSSEVLNPDFESETSGQPLVIHTKTKSGELIEQAGNKLLLKMGMAIGPQEEMYQEKPRRAPVAMEFAHVEERKIDFVIPAGYTISNPNDLKINQVYNENGQETMGFVSDYTINGNMLSIHIVEQYRNTSYPFEQFDSFKKIINASADFNKIVLVLEKKG